MAASREKQIEILERRKKVASLWLAHVTQERIAAALGVEQPCISKDIKAIKQQYRADRNELIDRDAAEYDAIEEDLAIRYSTERSLELIDRRLKVKAQRADLLGLNAPKLLAPVTPDGKQSYGGDWADRLKELLGVLQEFPDARFAVAERFGMAALSRDEHGPGDSSGT